MLCAWGGGGRILHENARRLAARATTKVAKVKGGHGPSLNQLPPPCIASPAACTSSGKIDALYVRNVGGLNVRSLRWVWECVPKRQPGP